MDWRRRAMLREEDKRRGRHGDGDDVFGGACDTMPRMTHIRVDGCHLWQVRLPFLADSCHTGLASHAGVPPKLWSTLWSTR